MKKAYDLGRVNLDARGNQRLYRLDPPMTSTDWLNESERTHEYVVVSAADVMFFGPETYIFPADKDGKVVSWGELDGSYRGELNHTKALQDVGYTVLSEEDQS